MIYFSDGVKQFLKNVLDVQPDLNLDICYQDSVITCSCPDGWYCCIHGDPSCTGTCCPAGTSCGGPRGPCYWKWANIQQWTALVSSTKENFIYLYDSILSIILNKPRILRDAVACYSIIRHYLTKTSQAASRNSIKIT